MTALSDALTAAQRSALAALEKAYVAEKIDADAFHEALTACGSVPLGLRKRPATIGRCRRMSRDECAAATVDPWVLFTHHQLDRIFRQVMSTEEAMRVCDGIRELLARDRERQAEHGSP